jgi:hypothetical protein
MKAFFFGTGLMLCAVILFVGGKWWVGTRTLEAVDMPISLSRGTIATGDFLINVHAYYLIEVWFPTGTEEDCYEDILRTRQITSIGGIGVRQFGRVGDKTAESVTAGPVLGGFDSKPNHYHLEVEVLSDTGCFNSRNPQLLIEATAPDVAKWAKRSEYVSLSSKLLGFFGTVLLIAGFLGRRSGQRGR